MRRMKCRDCNHAWTQFNTYEEIIEEKRKPSRLAEEAIIDILTSTESNGELAKKWKCNRGTPSLIRLGKIHASVAPDIPRMRPGANCKKCVHWIKSRTMLNFVCGLEIPESLREGPTFARLCIAYTEPN